MSASEQAGEAGDALVDAVRRRAGEREAEVTTTTALHWPKLWAALLAGILAYWLSGRWRG